MREIKYRGKNKDIGWVYGQLVYDINGNTYIIQEVELDSSYGLEETILYATMWYRVDKETIGQYTGLHDKNEKEIYEGDIVRVRKWSSFEIEVVKFAKGCFYAGMHYGSSTRSTVKLIQPKLTEVIGNIYENKELLNETN